MKKEQIEAMMQLVAEIVRSDETERIYNVVRAVQELAKIARALHKRYENACCYEWANTEKYEKATNRLEAKASAIAEEINVTIGFQRDPRGWPLIVKAGRYETRLG